MAPWIFSDDSAARIVLISLMACLYAGSVVISNHLLFPWAEDEPFRYWFHPAAGARLLLIMLFGIPAVIAVGVGSAAIYISPIVPQVDEYGPALLLGFSESFGLFLVLVIYGKLTRMKFPWSGITWQHIPFIAIFANLGVSLLSNLCRIILDISDPLTFQRDVSLTLTGDILGSIFFLFLLFFIRKSYLAYTRT